MMQQPISWFIRLRLKLIKWLAGDLWIILNATFTYDTGKYLLTRKNDILIHTINVKVACLVAPDKRPPGGPGVAIRHSS